MKLLASGRAPLTDNDAPPLASTAIGLVLTVSSFEEDHVCLRHILRGSTRITQQQAHTCQQALDRIRAETISVLICETNLSDGSWRDVLSGLAAEAAAPPLIVVSRLADDHLWAEVLNLGGYDVLSKPFDAKEVLWSVHHAFGRLGRGCVR
jgi:DNA-binding response OmpR family regulator